MLLALLVSRPYGYNLTTLRKDASPHKGSDMQLQRSLHQAVMVALVLERAQRGQGASGLSIW